MRGAGQPNRTQSPALSCWSFAVREQVDPSRPVVYEGGGESLAEGCGCTELTDIVCPM